MQSKIGAVCGVFLVVVAFASFAATAGATTVTNAFTVYPVSAAATSTFVVDNGMGGTVQCTTITDSIRTPTGSGTTPLNNAGGTGPLGAVALTTTMNPATFTGCAASVLAASVDTTANPIGTWNLNMEWYSTTDIKGVVSLPANAMRITITISAGVQCVITTNPTMAAGLQGVWTNGTTTTPSKLNVINNQLDFAPTPATAANCGAIGLAATASPAWFSANLNIGVSGTSANHPVVGM